MNILQRASYFSFALCCLLPTYLAAQRRKLSPSELITRSLTASRKLNVEGRENVVVTGHGVYATQFLKRSILRSNSGMSLTRWIDATGKSGAYVLEDGRWCKSYDPASGSLKVTRCQPRIESKDFAEQQTRLILRNYYPEILGLAPMAGRECYLLKLTPYNRASYAVTMWIDATSFYVLGHTETNWRTETISSSNFDGIKYLSSIPASNFQVLPSQVKEENFSRSEHVYDLASLRKSVNYEIRIPFTTPAGYEFVGGEKLYMGGNERICLRYSDGLADITICEGVSPQPRPPGFHSIKSYTDAMSNHVIEYQSGPMDFYIVGHTEMNALIGLLKAMNNDQERAFISYISKETGLPRAQISKLRNTGLNVDIIFALLGVAKRSSKPVESVVNAYQRGWSWQQIAKMNRINPLPLVKSLQVFKTP